MAIEISLVEAAHRLRLSYRRALDLALQGNLEARRTAEGRWRVNLTSVEGRLRQEQDQPSD